MPQSDCNQDHRYFVAEVIGVEQTGKVHLLYLCTQCGEAICKEFQIAPPGASMRLLKEEKTQKET